MSADCVREILFRGKRVDNGKWVYGNLLQYHNGQSAILEVALQIIAEIKARIRGVSLPEGELNYISLWIYGDGREGEENG